MRLLRSQRARFEIFHWVAYTLAPRREGEFRVSSGGDFKPLIEGFCPFIEKTKVHDMKKKTIAMKSIV